MRIKSPDLQINKKVLPLPDILRNTQRGGRGVIGSRARLRIWCREAWGFESLRPHTGIERAVEARTRVWKDTEIRNNSVERIGFRISVFVLEPVRKTERRCGNCLSGQRCRFVPPRGDWPDRTLTRPPRLFLFQVDCFSFSGTSGSVGSCSSPGYELRKSTPAGAGRPITFGIPFRLYIKALAVCNACIRKGCRPFGKERLPDSEKCIIKMRR